MLTHWSYVFLALTHRYETSKSFPVNIWNSSGMAASCYDSLGPRLLIKINRGYGMDNQSYPPFSVRCNYSSATDNEHARKAIAWINNYIPLFYVNRMTHPCPIPNAGIGICPQNTVLTRHKYLCKWHPRRTRFVSFSITKSTCNLVIIFIRIFKLGLC